MDTGIGIGLVWKELQGIMGKCDSEEPIKASNGTGRISDEAPNSMAGRTPKWNIWDKSHSNTSKGQNCLLQIRAVFLPNGDPKRLTQLSLPLFYLHNSFVK